MRVLCTLAAIVLVLVAFGPTAMAAAAKGPGGGGGGGSHPGGGQQFGQLPKPSQNHQIHNPDWYRWNWRPGYGWNYGYGAPYVVQSPIWENPAPMVFSGGLIRIINPATSGVTLNYTLNGVQYSIQPGYSQALREDRRWVIGFSRGMNLGAARYTLEPGLYTFAGTDHGWELYRGAMATPSMATAPVSPPAPQAPQPAPGNPAPSSY